MATPRNNESIWSRGGAASGRAWSSNTTTARGGEVGSSGSSRGSWRGGRGGGGSRNDSIHAGGFRKAVGEVGRKPGEMEMLLSPSRGIEDDATSLKNPDVQRRFRDHIDAKLVKFDAEGADASSVKRKEELGIILLDLRKLREGLTSIRRVDSFAAEVYETSVQRSIQAANWQQLGACLPHLVLELHPALASSSSDLSTTLSSLSIGTTATSTASPQSYTILYLLHLLIHHLTSTLPTFHQTLALFPPLPPSSPPHKLYQTLLTTNYIAYSTLLRSASLTRYELAILRSGVPLMRERSWERIEKAYKMKGDLENAEWLEKVLCFEKGDEDGLRGFLEGKGRSLPKMVSEHWGE